jgi:hypothetical protein
VREQHSPWNLTPRIWLLPRSTTIIARRPGVLTSLRYTGSLRVNRNFSASPPVGRPWVTLLFRRRTPIRSAHYLRIWMLPLRPGANALGPQRLHGLAARFGVPGRPAASQPQAERRSGSGRPGCTSGRVVRRLLAKLGFVAFLRLPLTSPHGPSWQEFSRLVQTLCGLADLRPAKSTGQGSMMPRCRSRARTRAGAGAAGLGRSRSCA